MKTLSLILPIYNVEEYLSKCLNSIYSQGVNEDIFEVIAVIDGSPDNSIDVAEEYARKHKNLIVIDKENGGVSSARNEGIDAAKGRHIMFIDPDDILLPDSMPAIIDNIEREHSDLMILRSFYDNSSNEIYSWKNKICAGTTITGLEAYNKRFTRGAIWGVVYCTEFLNSNNLRFPLGIKNSEDSILFMQCQILAQTVHFADIKTYSVTERPGSASRSMDETRLKSWFKALDYIKNLKKEKKYRGEETSIADGLIYSAISDITNNAITVMGWKAKRFLKSNGIKTYLPIGKENVRHSSSINKLLKITINMSYDMFFLISYIKNTF